MKLLEGKSALITGASRGIGEAVARLFANEGAKVVLFARSEAVETIATSIVEAGGEALAVRGDVSKEADVSAAVMACKKTFGGLDILVNNAGILRQALLGMTRADDARAMLETNVMGPFLCTQLVARLMSRKQAGSIVNIASIAGTQGIDGTAAYGASKAAVLGLTQALAKELAPSGIRVNAVAPGFIDTEMTRGLDPVWFEKRLESIRMGRIGTPEDIARAVLFFASELAGYVTGQVLGVDGGMQV